MLRTEYITTHAPRCCLNTSCSVLAYFLEFAPISSLSPAAAAGAECWGTVKVKGRTRECQWKAAWPNTTVRKKDPFALEACPLPGMHLVGSGFSRALVSLLTLWAHTPWPHAAWQVTEIHWHPQNTDCLRITNNVFLQHTQKSLADTSQFQILPCLYWSCKTDNTLSHKGDKRRLCCQVRARTNNFCYGIGSTTSFNTLELHTSTHSCLQVPWGKL